MQLAAFTTFEICSILNLLSCNYVNFSNKFLVTQKIFALSLLSNNIPVPTDNNLFVPAKNKFLMIKLITNVYMKNLLRFLNSNIAGGIDKRLNNLQRICSSNY